MRSARGFELAARPVDWITLKCCGCPSVLDLELCRASGEVWDRAGGEAERAMGTRVGGLEVTFLVWLSFLSWCSAMGTPGSGLSSLFAVPVIGIKAWGQNEINS